MMDQAEIDALVTDADRIIAERVFQPGEAKREPKNDRERAAVARWIEIDRRRAEARAAGKDFHYTDAERQLKRRLLKAGLIITKPQPKQSRRDVQRINLEIMIGMAKNFAAKGDPGAIETLRNLEERKKQDAWMRRQRMLRKLEPSELKSALDDVMKSGGLRRPLLKLWQEFIAEFKNSNPERQQAFLDNSNIPAELMQMAGDAS